MTRYVRDTMAYTLVLLRHGESTWNQENLFTGWHDVPLSTDRRGRGGCRRRDAPGRGAARSTRSTPRCSSGGPDGRPRPRRPRPAVAAGRALLAAQRAPLRRPPGPRQEADRRAARRRAGQALAAQLRRAAAARRARLTRASPQRRALRPAPSRRPPGHPSAWTTSSCGCSPTGTTPSSPTCGPG